MLYLKVFCNNMLDFVVCNLSYKISDYGCNICTFYHSVTRCTLRMYIVDDSLMMTEVS
jgi:hypothetical protein